MKPGPHGVKQEQVRALLAATAGGMTASEVAERLQMTRASASSTLRRLERYGSLCRVGIRKRARGSGKSEHIYTVPVGAPAFDPYAAARRKNPQHNGMTARIRALLALAGPLTTLELAERLGSDEKRVNMMLTQLTARLGGVMACGTTPQRYALYRPPMQDQEEGARRAQRIEIGRGFANWPGPGRPHY